jgi:hypothetical protein
LIQSSYLLLGFPSGLLNLGFLNVKTQKLVKLKIQWYGHVLHMDKSRILLRVSGVKMANNHWGGQVRQNTKFRVGKEGQRYNSCTYGRTEKNGGGFVIRKTCMVGTQWC